MSESIPAIRVIHLLGGLRAFEDELHVYIGVDCHPPIFRIKRPSYAALYEILHKLGFTVVGAEFFAYQGQLNGQMPIDWQVWDVKYGFRLMETNHEWNNIRYHAAKSGDNIMQDIASRIGSYLELLNLRMRNLSNAYHITLRGRLSSNDEVKPGLFSDM